MTRFIAAIIALIFSVSCTSKIDEARQKRAAYDKKVKQTEKNFDKLYNELEGDIK